MESILNLLLAVGKLEMLSLYYIHISLYNYISLYNVAPSHTTEATLIHKSKCLVSVSVRELV